MSLTHREHLGDFSSVVCFKAVIVGVEDTLGEDGAAVVFTRAGKVRGHELVKSLGLTGSKVTIGELAKALNDALGSSGTKLCAVNNAYEDGENIVVETSETVCSAGELDGSSRKCTFTLGAVGGAIEAVYGKVYVGKHTDSVLRGGTCDKFVFSPLM